MASKKNVVSVPGYYVTRKKEQHGKFCQPTEDTTPVQLCPELTTMLEEVEKNHDRYKAGGNQTSLCNGNSGLNPIKTANPIITPVMNSINYGIPKKSINVEILPAKESYTADMPGKEKEVEIISRILKGINCQCPSQKSSQKIPRVPTRVSTQAKCVLPSWTCRDRPVTQSQKQTIPKITGKKRELVISKDCVELTLKRLQISHNVDDTPTILAKADHQPRQEQ